MSREEHSPGFATPSNCESASLSGLHNQIADELVLVNGIKKKCRVCALIGWRTARIICKVEVFPEIMEFGDLRSCTHNHLK